MRGLLLGAVALSAICAIPETVIAGPFDGTRCVPTRLPNGRAMFQCGRPSHRMPVFHTSHCRMLYNAYSRRYERICS